MKKIFNYTRFEDDSTNNIVECTLDLARASYEKNRPSDYNDKNKELCESLGKKLAEGSRYEAKFESEGLAMYKNPMVNKDMTIRGNFDVILSQVVTSIVPEVVNDAFEGYIAEIHQIGYGDTASFVIESNDLFKVNQKAEGVRKGVDQPMFDDEILVNAHPVTIDTCIDWYPFAAGKFDMGNFAMKIARSFMAYIFLKAVRGMISASSSFGPAYNINGVAPTLWTGLKERVEAANGGMNVVAIGTATALANCSLGGNYQVQIGEEMNKVGYLDQYLNVPLIGIHNVLVPGTTNTTAKLALPDNKIYFIPVGGVRPVKIVFEGDQISVAFNPDMTSDRRYGISIEMRVGVSAICGHKYGTVTL